MGVGLVAVCYRTADRGQKIFSVLQRVDESSINVLFSKRQEGWIISAWGGKLVKEGVEPR